MYSHDTYGLGHLTRTLRLARAVIESLPRASVLVLTGSPVAHRFDLPPRVDYVKLPSVIKQGPGAYAARSLALGPGTIRRLRSRIILETVALYRPHLFLVDNVPLGMKGEIRDTLLHLKRRDPPARLGLNLRDVLDEPGAIRAAWTRDGVFDLLEEVYDFIHVFGSPDVYDAVGAYALPPRKTHHLGYVAPYPDECGPAPPLPPASDGRARVLVTTGGGGDGGSIVSCVLRMQRDLGPRGPFEIHLVSGPFAGGGTAAREAAGAPAGVTVHGYVDHLPARMRECDLVLSMGGYNTLSEIMCCARRSLVVPRIHPRREQEIRARALERLGIVRVLDPRALDPRSLERAMREALESSPIDRNGCPPLDGTGRFRRRVRDAVGGPGEPDRLTLGSAATPAAARSPRPALGRPPR
jgi:predicted glycosyltransferase